jgi:hypothetical protein
VSPLEVEVVVRQVLEEAEAAEVPALDVVGDDHR